MKTPSTSNNSESAAAGAPKPAGQTGEPDAAAPFRISKLFRRLKWNEVVRRGDFVANGRRALEPWEGPGGFRADAFVKTIYRRKYCRA